MNKKFIHKPKIKIIYSEFRSSQKSKKTKTKTPHYYLKNERSSQSLIFILIKIRPKRIKNLFGGAAENCPRVQKVTI